MLGKCEHCLIGGDAESRTREREIAFRIGSIETDRDGIEQTRKLISKYISVFQFAEAVRINAHRHIRMMFLDPAQYGKYRVKADQRLAESAAHHLAHILPRQALKLLDNLGETRIMFDPERGFPRHLLHTAQAKNAVAVAVIRNIDIDGTLPLRLLAKALFHREITASRMCCIYNHNIYS